MIKISHQTARLRFNVKALEQARQKLRFDFNNYESFPGWDIMTLRIRKIFIEMYGEDPGFWINPTIFDGITPGVIVYWSRAWSQSFFEEHVTVLIEQVTEYFTPIKDNSDSTIKDLT